MRIWKTLVCVLVLIAGSSSVLNAEEGRINLKSVGPIVFGPGGLLLVSDPMEATIYAVETGDSTGDASAVKLNVDNLRAKVAAMLGTEEDEAIINDLAVNPVTGNAYLSVTRGSGQDAGAIILVVDSQSMEITEFSLENVQYTKTTLPNPAENRQTNRGNKRMQAITDMAYVDGQVYVAGLSNEEFASNLRAIPFPFESESEGASIEIYHAAHGKFETRSPIRTFAAYEISGETNLIAAYTCTPLVRIPVSSLKPDGKVAGQTVAELGNRNRPLDMVVYTKGDKDYILMANSHRGVMKIELSGIDKQESLTEPVRGGKSAGVQYDTIGDLKGIIQLDGLNSTHAVVIMQDEDRNLHLRTVPLP